MKFWLSVSWGTILSDYFEFGPVLQEEMSFKDVSYLELRQPLWFKWSGTICAIFVEYKYKDNSVKSF